MNDILIDAFIPNNTNPLRVFETPRFNNNGKQ